MAYEIKFDGSRCIAIKDGQRVTLISRHGKSLTPLFRDLAASIAKLKISQAVIDGEIVALDETGRPAFQLLQNHRSSKSPMRHRTEYHFFFRHIGTEAPGQTSWRPSSEKGKDRP